MNGNRNELSKIGSEKEWQGKPEIPLFSDRPVHRAVVEEIVSFLFLTPKVQPLVILPKNRFERNFKVNVSDFCTWKYIMFEDEWEFRELERENWKKWRTVPGNTRI